MTEWWSFDSGFEIAFFTKVQLDLVNSLLRRERVIERLRERCRKRERERERTMLP